MQNIKVENVVFSWRRNHMINRIQVIFDIKVGKLSQEVVKPYPLHDQGYENSILN